MTDNTRAVLPPPDPRQLKILISGAGIAGNALVYFLTQLKRLPSSTNLSITIIERHPTLRKNGLQIDLRGHGLELLDTRLPATLRDRLYECRAPEQGMAVVDDKGRRRARFLSREALRGKGRVRGSLTSEFEIMRSDMVQAFYNATSKETTGSCQVLPVWCLDSELNGPKFRGSEGLDFSRLDRLRGKGQERKQSFGLLPGNFILDAGL